VVIVKRLFRFVFAMTASIAVMAAAVAVMAPRVVDLVSAHHSDHERLSLKPLAERSYIYDRAGNKLGTLINSKNQNRVQVPLAEVPETVVGSILAAEDANFYKHSGVNVRSIARAVNANIQSGEVSQGGSTITQQVVKNSLVGNEQSLKRKVHEAFLSVELEKQLTEQYGSKRKAKDKILERYLNSVYFGGGAYGVKAAAEYYFNKDIKQLNWADAALLSALIRSPADYDPFRNPKLAKKRRHIVYSRLIATGRLTKDQVALLDLVPLPTHANNPRPPNDYFVEDVKQQLLDDPQYGLGSTAAARNEKLFSGGIHVYTTVDPQLYLQAVVARNTTLPNNSGDGTFPMTNPKNGRPTYGTQAIASVEPGTGAVRVLVGGPGYKRDPSHADLTGLPGRQPGSTMKAFTLAALLENHYVPSDTVSSSGCTFKFPGEQEPYHLNGNKTGTGTIQTMIQISSNCGFMRLAQVVGNDKIVEMAKRLGIRSPLGDKCYGSTELCPPHNLTLGTKEVAPIDMAGAFAVFANDGVRNAPYMVERIEDHNHKIIYQHQADPKQVIDPQVARLVTSVLVNNVQRGTGTKAQIDSGQPAAGKTGTTNDSTNVWFVGYTPRLATAIWMGAPGGNFDLASAGLSGATGGRFPAATWGRFYSAITAGQPIEDFLAPEPTRRGKSVGKIPYEVGGGGGSPTRRRPRQNTGAPAGPTVGTTPTTPTATTPTTPTVTPGSTIPGFGGGTGGP
jgi:membrane peptidoglycan carboxypeptidase